MPAQHEADAPAADELLVDKEQHSPLLRWLLHVGLPMLVSLCIHSTLIAILIFSDLLPWRLRSGSRDYEVTVAQAAARDDTLRWPTVGEFDAEAPVVADPFDYQPADALTELADQPTAAPGPADDGGFGLGSSGSSGVLGLGGGAGDGGGAGLGSGFGEGTGLGSAGMWNLRAVGDKFVYVVDFSGSIVVVVDDLKRELKRSIGRLRSKHKFNVILFYGTAGRQALADAFAPRLVPATARQKQRFFKWLDDKRPRGTTDPLPAIRRALAMEPDAIFLFSDGQFTDPWAEMQIAKANIARTQIHCLVFDEVMLADRSPNPRLTEGARRLRTIARDSGGKFKVVTLEDLKR